MPDLAALGWQPVFEENFAGTSLDESMWSIRKGPGASGPGLNTRNAIGVSGGELKISTYTDPGDNVDYTGEVFTGEQGRGVGFVGAYGYVEARIRLDLKGGTRSAFWTLSPSWHKSPFGDPAAAGPEFDIMEIWYNDRERINVGRHWDGFDEDHKSDAALRNNPNPSVPIQGNYHIYSLLWTPDGYRGFVDGVEVYRSTEAITYNPEYFLLSMHQSGTSFGGRPAGGYGALGSSSNSSMTVDYLKMWQRPVSEIPNQTFPANSPVSIPFSVQDYFYQSEGRAEPGSVRVTPTVTSGSAVVPAANVVVTGNGPADPDGTFGNRGFESSLAPSGTPPPGNWAVPAGMGTATTWTTRKHSGSSALRLTQPGGRVEQTITGLQPNTTYLAGGWYNLDLSYTDSNGNGRYDSGEPLTEPGDGNASVEWGVKDVDSARSGDQPVSATLNRNSSADAAAGWWAVTNNEWRWTTLTFTTGPDTTQVTLYVDNWRFRSAVAGTADSDLSFDDMTVQPLVPPDRTVTLRPNADATGSAEITLTATNAAGATLGTEAFTVTFNRGSTFRNGGFETMPLGSGWNLIDGAAGQGAAIVVEDPFRLDRMLELGNGASGFAIQGVTGLKPSTTYTLEVTGRVSATAPAGQGLGFSVAGFAGTDPCATASNCEFTSTSWSTRTVTFTTNPAGSTTINLADWNFHPGISYVDDVKLTTAASDAPIPPATAPTLLQIGERRIVSSAPYAIAVNQPGATITSVTSNNPQLVPNRNLGFKPSATGGILSVTPVPDRTGQAVITVLFLNGTTPDQTFIPLYVSDHPMVNPGFNDGPTGWSDATIATTGQRTGTGALQLNGSTAVTQKLTWLPYHTGFVLSGWGRAGARMTLRRNGVEDVATVNWTGSTYSQQSINFSTRLCVKNLSGNVPGCPPNGTDPTIADELWEVVLQDVNPGDGLAAFVDDLALIHRPAASTIRDLSIHVGQTSHSSTTAARVWVGRLPANADTQPGVVSVSSSATTVLPVANVQVRRIGAMAPYEWLVSARSNGVIGRSTVTVTFTDPATSYQTQRQFLVTINAGNNFVNGDFERDLNGWSNNWVAASTYDLVELRQGSAPPTPTAEAFDNALRVRHGVVGHEISGLLPNRTYRLRFSARGQDPAAGNPPPENEPVRVVIATSPNVFAQTELARVPVTPGDWSPHELTFTTGPSASGTVSVWLQVVDWSLPAPTATNCAISQPGEACFDDFHLSEV